MADGGQPIEDDIFTRTADVEEKTLRDRLVEWLQQYLITPLSIITDDPRAILGGGIVIVFLLMSTVGVIILEGPAPMDGNIFTMPFKNLAHPLGTGAMGQDILKQIVHASPAMLKMMISGALLSVGLGTFLGTVAGYKGGVIDDILMLITDTVLTIPGIVLVVVLASAFPPTDPFLVGLLLGIDNWPRLARTIRSQVLSLREEAFTEASRTMGLSEFTILRKDVITNLMPYITVNFAFASRNIIRDSVVLYFLGLLPFTSANWGVMMNEAYQGADLTNIHQIHWLAVPMVAIAVTSLGFMLLAQSLDRVFNVRLRARHADTGEEG